MPAWHGKPDSKKLPSKGSDAEKISPAGWGEGPITGRRIQESWLPQRAVSREPAHQHAPGPLFALPPSRFKIWARLKFRDHPAKAMTPTLVAG